MERNIMRILIKFEDSMYKSDDENLKVRIEENFCLGIF